MRGTFGSPPVEYKKRKRRGGDSNSRGAEHHRLSRTGLDWSAAQGRRRKPGLATSAYNILIL